MENLLNKLTGVVNKLPPEVQTKVQPYLATYGASLANLAQEQIISAVMAQFNGDHDAAFNAAVDGMSPDQKDAEGAALSARIESTRLGNAAVVATETAAAKAAATLFLSLLLPLL